MIKMKGKIFWSFFVFLLAISLISAATFKGKLGVSTGGNGQIVISSTICQEDWSGSRWGDCINDIQTFICFDKNICGTNNLMPAQCGNTQQCNLQEPVITSSPGGGGGGGGGSSGGSSSNRNLNQTSSSNSGVCVENWQCENWSNPDDQCGIRTCVDSNQCGTADLKPLISKKCPSTGLFSITGGAIGALGDFAKTSGGVATISGSMGLIVLMVILFSFKKKKLVNKSENSEDSQIKKEHNSEK